MNQKNQTNYPVTSGFSNQNQIVEINETNFDGDLKNTVNARELHEALESKRDFSTWIKRKIEVFGFTEGIDYLSFPQYCGKPDGGRPSIEYYITLDMAKHIALVENTEKGRYVRNYFIDVENRFNSPEYIVQKALVIQQSKIKILEKEKGELLFEKSVMKPKADAYNEFLSDKNLRGMMEVSKIFGIGIRSLYKILREEKIIFKSGGDNYPAQKYIEKGYFEVKEHLVKTPYIEFHRPVVKVTTKGIEFIRKTLKEHKLKEQSKNLRLKKNIFRKHE